MNNWWYANNENKTGPVDADEIKQLLLSERIGQDTMFWQEGMETWEPLKSIDAFSSLRNAVPPPIPPKTKMSPLLLPMASAWPRFFARSFDLWWESLIVAFALSAVLSYYFLGFGNWINKPGSDQLFGILCIPICLFLDALFYACFKNTPGKALLGLTVSTFDGSRLSFSRYLKRDFSMWISGLGGGIPIVTLVTMVKQSRRLGKNQPASYDETTGYRVRANQIGFFRKAGFAVAFFALFAVLVGLQAINRTEERKRALDEIAVPTYSWVNPSTHAKASISSNWTATTQSNLEEEQIYMFEEKTNHAAVVFAVQKLDGISLKDYVDSFKNSNAKTMLFTGPGRFSSRSGHALWESTGSMVDPADSRLNVEIVQVGSTFWRTVTVQAKPFTYTDTLVDTLVEALWKTVKLTKSADEFLESR